MIRKFYVHNFRSLENFELRLEGVPSVLLIGRNGTGKTSIGKALEILQKIARGINRVSALLGPKDIGNGRQDAPVRFEIEVEIRSKIFIYTVAFEFPEGFRELRVLEEKLVSESKVVFSRELAQVRLHKPERDSETGFGIDWHVVALPIIQQAQRGDPIFVFKEWLANALILWPVPFVMNGTSDAETLRPDPTVANLGEWLSGLLVSAPSAYAKIDKYLKEVMPDFKSVKNPLVGGEGREVFVTFEDEKKRIELPFRELSDGEKCFLVYALVIAANDAYGPLLCFWDEPDNFLGPSEVSPSIMSLRKAFSEQGQIIITSHNPEAVRRFSDENTRIFHRNSHLEPTMILSIDDLRQRGDFSGDFVDALLRGDVGA